MNKSLFILSILHCGIVFSQETHRPEHEIGREWYPKYVTFLPEDKLDSALVYANTDLVPVIYKVNKYDLRNTTQLDSITQLVNRILHDVRVEPAYIWIGGSASPEGPIRWNKQLGHYRSTALANYLRVHTEISEDMLRVENLEEDWYSVTRILQRIDFPNKEQILDIIAQESDRAKRKTRIKNIDGGKTWHRLIREVFPPFRNARMVIVCHAKDIQKETIPLAPVVPELTIPEINIEVQPLQIPMPSRKEKRFFAVKTNALFLAALTANVGFETELWRRWSLDVPIWYSPYDIKPTRKLRLLAVQPEIRHWLKKAGKGHFFGLHTHIVGFNVAVNDHGRYQDPNHALWGMGLSYGYVTHLDKAGRWGLEFNIGGGFAEYDYDTYHNRPNGARFRSGSNFYWGVTRAGISFSYKWYKTRKNGRDRHVQD